MNLQSFVFIGRSGCGKGTQIEMLMKLLKEKDPEREILYIYTGQEFRNFIQGPSATQKISKSIYDSGGLMPEFLTVHMWVKPLVEKYKGNQHIIFDGTPRKFHEAGVLHSMFSFYKLEKPWVINIGISAEEAVKRLLKRERQDDTEADIRKRLGWYETDVAPTIEFYRDNPNYNFLYVDGEKSPEDVHLDIAKKMGLL
jgi:adenylate kinase family enzyme